jgi:SAM-dependent methyltransferase
MQKALDWLDLWRELATRQEEAWRAGGARDGADVWRERARGFDAEVKRRWATCDSSRDFVAAQLQANPDWIALDIGGGTGAWTVFMARFARHVTVIEPSSGMIEVMRENLAESKVRNVEIIQKKWPEAEVNKHDLTLCAHAMYGFPDFAKLARSIEAVTRRICVLVMRSPTPDDLLCTAALHIWGQPYDSPNFQVAYNALLQMGIFPNVLMEDTGLWDPWSSASLDEAFAEAKRRLGLQEDHRYDDFLHNLLTHNLVPEEDRLLWPRSIRTALVYWTPFRR